MNVNKVVPNKFDELRRESVTCGRKKLGSNKRFVARITRSKLKQFDRRVTTVEIDFPDRRDSETYERRVAAHCDSEVIIFA